MDGNMQMELKNFLLKGEYPIDADKQHRYALKRRANNFRIIDDDLFYIRKKASRSEIKSKVVSTAEEADAVFREFHYSDKGTHSGQIKTTDAISQRYYWPGMSVDIKEWVSKCTVCQKQNKNIKVETDYQPIKTKIPFELVGVDLIGKLVKTDQQNQYICVIIDYCTKWAQAYPLKTKSAVEVTQAILKFIYQFEVPKRILTDQGREFVNTINSEVCKVLGIKRSLCAPYHPQTNGLVERLNGTIQRVLAKLVQDKPNTWDQYLDAVMFGLRTKKQLTTEFSPFYLMFGREARYPSQVPENFKVDSSLENACTQEVVAIDIAQHDKIMEIVQRNVEKTHERTRRRLSKKSDKSVKVGDMVWRRNVRSEQRKGGKLDPDYLGPFMVTKIQGKSVDLVDSLGKSLKNVNLDHLKHHHEETPRIPNKLRLQQLPPSQPPDVAVAECPSSGLSSPAVSQSSPPAAEPFSPAESPTYPASSLTSLPAGQSSPPAVNPSSPAESPTSPAASLTSPPAALTSPPAGSSSPSAAGPSSLAAGPTSPPDGQSSPLAAGPSSPSSGPSSPAAGLSSPQAVDLCSPTVSECSPPAVGLCSPTASESSPPAVGLCSSASSQCFPPAGGCKVPFYEKCIKDAWSGNNTHVLLSRLGAYKLFFEDFRKTAPNCEVESEVINAYIAHAVENNNKRSDKKAFHIDSYEMTNIWEGKSSRLKCDPTKYNIILGVVHEPGHWILTVIFPSERRSLVLDPLGNDSCKIKQCLESTRAFIRKRGCQVSRWTANTEPHTLQKDGSSCGIFVLKYAEKILAGEPLQFSNDPSAAEKYRRQVALTLLNETDDLSELCHYCGEKDAGQGRTTGQKKENAWVQCDVCDRWFHIQCAKMGDPRKYFSCAACQFVLPV